MQVELTEERAFRIAPRLSQEEAEGRAWARRVDAFGALSKMAAPVSTSPAGTINLGHMESSSAEWVCDLKVTNLNVQ